MNPRVAQLFDGFIKKPGASETGIEQLLRVLNVVPPSDYIELLQQMNGGEGFVDNGHYLRLYPVDKLAQLNQAFGVKEFAPELVIFGSDGGGEAFAFYAHTEPVSIIRLPFIPMDICYSKVLGLTVRDALATLVQEGNDDQTARPAPNPALVGKEIHEIQPIVFGGDPVDPQNKVLLSTDEYTQVVVWWNRQYRALINR